MAHLTLHFAATGSSEVRCAAMTTGTQGMEKPPGYEPVQRFRIDVVAGPDSGKSFTSSSPRAVIGSHESADLILTDPTVSRFHVEIAIDGGRAVVRDLGSRNGTFVGGVQVMIAMLDASATLALGHTELRYVSAPDPVRVPLSEHEHFGRMVGCARAMRAAFATLERAAESDATV